MLFLGSAPIGGPILGWVSQNLGARVGLLVGATACLGAGAWGLAVARRDVTTRSAPTAALSLSAGR